MLLILLSVSVLFRDDFGFLLVVANDDICFAFSYAIASNASRSSCTSFGGVVASALAVFGIIFDLLLSSCPLGDCDDVEVRIL